MAAREIPSDKSYTVAVCLSGVFGVFGIQHFYMGRWIEGIIDVSLFAATIFLFVVGEPVWAFAAGALDALHTLIVTIMLLTGSFRDGSGRLITFPGQRLRTPHSDVD